MPRKCACCKRKLPAPGRSECWSCKKRKTYQNDPVKYCWVVLRNNAKRRGKEFTITLDFFRNFCYATDYMQNKGKTANSYSIDRIDNDKGYTPDNIRILTLADNSSKHTKKLSYDWQHKTATVVSIPDDNDKKIF